MLIGFKFENFSSYKNENVMSLLASNIKEQKSNVFKVRKMELLKFISIYGKNASGKSNVFKALKFMKSFIFDTTKLDSTSKIEVNNYKLSTESQAKPTSFEVAFIIDDIIYKYGFKIFNNEVIEEWLEQNVKRFTTLFYRSSSDGEGIKIGNSFKEGKDVPKNQIRKNGLFLPIVAVFNGKIANKILQWFKNVNIISGDKLFEDITINLGKEKEFKEKIVSFLKTADLGIENYKIEEKELPNEMKEKIGKIFELENKNGEFKTLSVRTSHSTYNEDYEKVGEELFDMNEFESEGTKKFFALAGPLLDTLKNGKILFIDELDSKLHPLMVKFIIDHFNSEWKNSNNAQLIINTHNTNLLRNNILRRDQIWFVEKNKYGESELYSLDEYKDEERNKKVRNDESFEKNYLLGKYGAIPRLYEEYRLFDEFPFLDGEKNGK